METRTIHQQFVDRQRAVAIDFLETALDLVECGSALGDDFTEWEQKVIYELIHFADIPDNPTRDQLIERLEFYLEGLHRRGDCNPLVTVGENNLFKMVNELRIQLEDAL